MSIEENKALIRRYIEAINGKDKPAAVVGKYVTDKELLELIDWSETAFPHFEFLIDDMIAEGDQVAVRATFKGTHKGDLLGVSPTGKYLNQPFNVIYRIDEGKIVEHWMVINRLEVMQQLGVIPEDLSELAKKD